MNMHLAQSVSAAVELQEIASVARQVISPGKNSPVITLVQDSLLGFSMLSETKNIDKNDVMDMLMWSSAFTGFKNGVIPNKMDGLDVIQKYVLENLYDNKDMYPYNLFTKNKTNKSSVKKVIQAIFNDYGKDECRRFLDNTSHVANRWLCSNGFSVGLSDLYIKPEVSKTMKKIIETQKKDVLDIICNLHDDFQNDTNDSNEHHFEGLILTKLSNTLNQVSDVALENISEDNRLMKMIRSGSKGSSRNVSQMISSVGQQSIAGKRVQYGFTDRTTPHFHRYDDGARSRGFVNSSYGDGLQPSEFFFHAIAGREGLIDTAVKTSETGYIQRRMVKAMEDLIVHEDGTVRNNIGNIVQMHYGGDGFDVTKIEEYVLPDWFVHRDWENKKYKDRFELIRENFTCSKGDKLYIPMNIPRMIHLISLEYTNSTKATNTDIWKFGDKLWNEIVKIGNNTKWLMDIHLNYSLEAYILLLFTPKVIDNILGSQRNKFKKVHLTRIKKKIIDLLHTVRNVPGEPVGIISAQSLGEPATQLTLNTFHSAGVNKNRGVPRLKEILRATKNMKSASVTVYPKEIIEKKKDDISKINALRNNLVQVKLSNILKRSEIIYEPIDLDTKDIGPLSMYDLFTDIARNITKDNNEGDLEPPVEKGASWILNLVFDRIQMNKYNIGLTKVYSAISDMLYTVYGQDISVMFSDESVDNVMMRLILTIPVSSSSNNYSIDTDEEEEEEDAINDNPSDEDALMILQKLESDLISRVSIGGVSNITGAVITDSNIHPVEGKKTVSIETFGSNLLEILGLEDVDKSITCSNDLREIYDVLGVEAARNAIINEFQEIVNGAHLYVNNHHLALLADTMCRPGYFVSVTRHGINKSEDNSILSRASFEKTPSCLFEAAVFGLNDNMEGVSANVMFGQPLKMGTGFIDLEPVEKPNINEPITKSAYYSPGIWDTVQFV
jgi:DNA-directed RNA polymerase II subunit RPB1